MIKSLYPKTLEEALRVDIEEEKDFQAKLKRKKEPNESKEVRNGKCERKNV